MLQGHLLCTTFNPINCSCDEILAVKTNLRWDFFPWGPFQPQMLYDSMTLTCCHSTHGSYDMTQSTKSELVAMNNKASSKDFWIYPRSQTRSIYRGFKEMWWDSYIHRINAGKELKIIKCKCQLSTATIIPEITKTHHPGPGPNGA